MIGILFVIFCSLGAALQTRRNLILENLALRHPIAVLNRTVKKPKLSNADRILWICLRAVWSRWQRALVILQPQTVVG